jgi:aminoglycoside phosphotransferase family enzyme/predicted kinase
MIVEDQSATVAFLSDPSSYGEGIAAVERIDTHISHLFLAGERAYKLKRAVKFSYLDFSSAALRAKAAERELALNRRTAPELYLEVRHIRRTESAGLAFEEAGELVDSVVVMRRFDQDALFDRMAERGQLTRPLMLELADRIAEFHRAAEVDRDCAGKQGLIELIDANALNLGAASPAVFDPEAVIRLTLVSHEVVERLGELIEARRQAGKVRLCHGDLHLRNICLFEGRPTLFDCIEFSRAIACIDVLYDLSFLLMDLLHRGLGGLANAAFNRYFDREAEVEGVAALPLFLSMHAAIRAHVMAAALHQEDEPEKRERAAGEARGYVGLAGRLLEPAPRRLIAIAGLSGTGKSTLARALAPDIGAAPGARVLRSDVIRKRLLGVAPETRLPEEAYAEQAGEQVYDALREEAERLLRAGHSVVVDAVFAKPQERAAFGRLARGQHAGFLGLWLEAPGEVLEARIASRSADASDATVEVLHKQLTWDLGAIDWQRLDAGGTPEAVQAAIRPLLTRPA